MAPKTKEQALELIRDSQLPDDIKEQMEKQLRPTIVISSKEYDPSSLSYFGGVPLGPENWEWPEWDAARWASARRGYEWVQNETPIIPLTFIAQIDLSELPYREDLPKVPRTGILYFFCDNDICPSSYHSLDPEACSVRYSKLPREKLRPLAPPDYVVPIWGGPERLKRYSMGFSEAWQLPDIYDITPSPPTDLRVDYTQFLLNQFQQYSLYHLFGYHEEHNPGTIKRNAFGLRAGEGKKKQRSVKEDENQSPWIPLLQVNEFRTAGHGRLTFSIQQPVLEKGLFEGLYVSWDEE